VDNPAAADATLDQLALSSRLGQPKVRAEAMLE
jgi:hypothetical protein